MGFWGTYFQSNPTDIAVHAARPSGLYLASFRDKSCHPSVLEPLNVRGFSKKKKILQNGGSAISPESWASEYSLSIVINPL